MKYKTTNIMKTREITFRGLKADGSNEWVYGNLNQLKDGTFILEKDFYGSISEPDYHSVGMGCGLEDRNITDRYEAMQYGWDKCIERQNELLPCFIEVIPSTVGMCIFNEKGVFIYQGDKIKHINGYIYKVIFDGFKFGVNPIGTDIILYVNDNFYNKSEVIGNIHQK